MQQRLVECVPNISEGRRNEVIEAVSAVVNQVEGVKLLDVDPGKSTNRTVITFVGPPETIGEAAFQLIKKAAELIDMRQHRGEHPRMGATDVCPFVPVSGVSMEECVDIARTLAKRVGDELGIPGYLYEAAALTKERQNLATCRKGQYEGLAKLETPQGKPDFGPASWNEQTQRSGATAIGARDFLIAYNINLNTTSSRRANAIAFDIRESGRVKREGGPGSPILKDANGEPLRQAGSLKAVKGIGWYIEEYGIAQLSLNLTNIRTTPVHIAFDEACARAHDRGIRVTGSELVGLLPLRVLTEAADYFLKKQERSLGISDAEKVKIAVKSLGLDDLAPFDPSKRVIEYVITDANKSPLLDMTLLAFAEETASESPAPGGGSVAAYASTMGVALATMVANLSAHKRGWDERWAAFSKVAERGVQLQAQLAALVDADTAAFNQIMEAYGLPKATDNQQKVRHQAIQDATRHAIEIPLQVARLSMQAMEVASEMASIGNPNSITDAGVGAMAIRTGVKGAILNARVNLADLEDVDFAKRVRVECEELWSASDAAEAAVIARVDEVLGS
ncbi:glutamate formimidoyltransferase [Flavobacteriales bacterium]|jgi:glutamate formiminotransferase/formiminotetrahydrofolate cyclodeaminase|nr:glutamate formimidoyltransferase [Flavobacteriales bacterium]MDA9019083.1 glutamate formimidoyltransferase [Flavobacteriales bacterium]